MKHTGILIGLFASHANAAFGAAQNSEPPTTNTVLQRVREATGIAALSKHASGVSSTGRTTMLGNDVEFSLLFDAQGRFARQLSGPIAYAVGWNGRDAWQVEFGGQGRIVELGERSEIRIVGAAITGAWLAPDSPLTFENPRSLSEDRVSLDFKFRDGFETGTVEIAASDWLPRRWSIFSGGPANTIDLSDWRDFGGFRIPGKFTITTGGGSAGIFTIEKLTDAPTFIRSPYDPPPPNNDDIRFSESASSALQIERAPTGHLLVQPRIDGKDAGWFILDTGAGATVIDRSLATARELKQIGTVTALGVGGPVESPMHRLDLIEVGPLGLRNPVVINLDLAFLEPHLGRKIAGVVGFDVISRCIVELDLAAGRAALHDPQKYQSQGTAWQPMQLSGRVPAVQARIEGHEALIAIDSGASGKSIVINYPAVQRLKLLEGRETAQSSSGGVGGAVSTRSGKLKWIEICGHRIDDVDANFATEARGAFASAYTAGTIGGPILRQFTLLIDYPGRRIAWNKNAAAQPTAGPRASGK